jgi:peptidoglycan/LPS O-acetylase OafA/YrhL
MAQTTAVQRPSKPAATPAPAARGTRLDSLTGLRFIAACLVFLFHASMSFPPFTPFADQGVANGFHSLFSKAGWVGVSFFFVLSGFVLTWSARPRDSLAGFYRRRLVKIFPSHVAAWALAMVLFAGATAQVAQWLPNLLLIHSWFPQHSIFISINAPSWSLCSELLFYLLFPVFLRGVRRIRESRLWWWAGAMVAGMLGIQLVTDFLLPTSPASPEGYPVSVWQFWFSYNFPPVRLFEFVLGMIMARLVLEGRWPRLGLPSATALFAAGYAIALNVPWLYGLSVATIIPVAAVICTAATCDVERRRVWLRSRLMVKLGEVSFGFYMVHVIVLYTLRKQMGFARYDVLTGTALLIGLFLASLAAGWLLHVLVEQPAMRLWGGTGRLRRAPADAQDALGESDLVAVTSEGELAGAAPRPDGTLP